MELVWENLFKNRRFAWPTFPAMPCQNFLHAEGTVCVAVTSESWYERRPKRDFTQAIFMIPHHVEVALTFRC